MSILDYNLLTINELIALNLKGIICECNADERKVYLQGERE